MPFFQAMWTDLPLRDPMSSNRGMGGKLMRAMHGTRDAPMTWQKEVTKTMTSLGFECSALQPAVFWHAGRDALVVAHVDDFLCSGSRANLSCLFRALKEKYDIKMSMLEKEGQEVKYLNRTIRWTRRGLEMEGDGNQRNEHLVSGVRHGVMPRS